MVNGNRNWLSIGGRFQLQPSEFVKLALVLWCADVYARKDKLLAHWRHLLIPMMPVCLIVVGLVVGQGDLGTALVLFAIVLGLLWVVGAPARLFWCRPSASRPRLRACAPSPNGSRGSPASSTRSATTTAAAGRPAMGSSRWRPVGCGDAASAPAARSGAACLVRTPTTSSRSSARSSACSARLSSSALFVSLAYAGIRIATRTKDMFVRYAAAGIVIWLLARRSSTSAWCSDCCP